MRAFGVPQILDLTSDGGSSVSVTPGVTPQKVEFLVQAPKAGVGDAWPLALNYVSCITTVFDQAAGGAGAAVSWDQLAIVADSFDVQSPALGNTHQRNTYTGPITKHLIEFVSSGYEYSDGARIQLIAADGDVVLDMYYVLPMAHECMDRPHHSAVWLGWLNATKVVTYVGTAAAVDPLSTGAVLKAPTSVRTWIEYVVSNELVMPTMNQWVMYETPATGGTTAIVNGIGTANGLQDVLDGSRVAGMFELMNINSMGGSGTADNITSLTIPQIAQDVTVNIDALFAAYRRVIGGHQGPISGVGAFTIAGQVITNAAVLDRGGNPNTMASGTGTNNRLNSANAMYVPYRAPGRNAMLSKMLKFFGDLKITRTFANVPSSGKFRFVFNELRELGPAKKQELIGKTGRPASLEKIHSQGSTDGGAKRTMNTTRKQAVLPERVNFG